MNGEEEEFANLCYGAQPTVRKITDANIVPPSDSLLLEISFDQSGYTAIIANRPSLGTETAQESASAEKRMNDKDIQELEDLSRNEDFLNSSQSQESTDSNGQFMRRVIKRKPIPKTVTRKRTRNVGNSIDQQAKKARAEGSESFGRKQPIAAKEMKPGCSDTCRFSCYKKITDVDRKNDFQDFWALADKKKQWECLDNWVCIRESGNSSDTEAGTTSTRSNIIKYNFRLPSSNGPISVCRTMFLNTLDISYQWIRTAKLKSKKKNATGVMEGDKRGSHSSRPFKYPEYMKDKAREHIRRFPVMESHFCRENSQRKYLEQGLSMAKMYRMYVSDVGESKDDPTLVSQSMYEYIFNSEFNYGFFQPKKDRCEQCEAFKNSSVEEQGKRRVAYDSHLRNKSEARRLMKEDKKRTVDDTSVCCANFDLQKILSTPRSEVSVMYYMSKLSVWNFTIFELGRNIGHCNVWNETIGKRGSNEIASFVWKFLATKSESGIKEFIFYTDNCGGQNRNQNIFSMYMKAANEFNVQIIHRFLEVGHTQSDGDSMHARIESHCRGKDIFTQNEWARLMVECKKENPYNVEQLTQDQIFNFENLADQFNWKPVKISKLREIKVVPQSTSVQVRYDFFDDVKKVIVLKKNNTIGSIEKIILDKAYNAKMSLAEKKKADLLAMLKKNLIPEQYVSDFKKVTSI